MTDRVDADNADTPSDQAQSIWPLQGVAVTGLFGQRTFGIALDSVATILTGENGSGKSTFLRAIQIVADGDWRQFYDLPLTELRLEFADGSHLMVREEDDETVTVSDGHSAPWAVDLNTSRDDQPYRRRLSQMRSHIQRTRPGPERDQLQFRYATMREEFAAHTGGELFDPPEWLASIRGELRTKLISARRLEHRLRPDPREVGERPISVVEEFAQEILSRMREQLSAYAAESRRQEKSLPSRIVSAMQNNVGSNPEELATSVDELRAQVRELADSLARVGLFDEDDDPDQRFAEYPRDNANILLAIREVYAVTLQRLERLTDLRSELGLFASFLNDRLTSKEIELNQRTGIDVVLNNGERIRPSSLSSGEQQLLALGYELIFGTTRRSVVLLDEPELSLHVAWLQGLLSEFIGIGERRELQFIIATHSPSVFAGAIERERSLDTAGL